MRRAALPFGLLLLAACGPSKTGAEFQAFAPSELHPTGRVEVQRTAHVDDTDVMHEGLRLRVAEAPADAPDVLGTTDVEGATLVFTPRFPLQRGLTYQVSTDGAAACEFEFAFPLPALEPSVTVETLSPCAEELPANLLKFYVYFSAPMRRGEAYSHARLLDDTGAEVRGAFIPIEPELWNPERTRLTLLIDPGRIKRDLVLHEELGPVLYPDRNYVLIIDSTWRDAQGAPLLSGVRHPFRTAASDLSSPKTDDWELTSPSARTTDPLTVRFDEALDRALALRLLWIEGPDGSPVPGESTLTANQTVWSFHPAQPWAEASYALLVPPVLEDLTGNSVGRPFEVRGREDGAFALDPVAVRRTFRPR